MNPLKKLAGQTAIYGLSTILPRLLNYLLVPLFTYKFTNPADFGVNTEIYAYISFLNIIFTYGMETAFFNFVNKNVEKDTVYSTALISILISSGILIVFGSLFSASIARVMGYQNNVQFILWMLLIVATDAIMAIPFARLRSEQKPLPFALIKISNIIINISINVFFIHYCKNAYESNLVNHTQSTLGNLYNPRIGIGYAFFANLIANIVSVILLSKQFLGFTYKFDFTLWIRMIKYALPLLIVGLAGMINETFDRILLKYLLPENLSLHEIGVYGACYKISILMTIFIQAFKFAAEPFFFSNAAHQDSKKMNAVVTKYFAIGCCFIFLVTMMNLEWIKYFVSKNYWEGLSVVPILLLANMFLGIYFNLSIWYKLTEKTKYGAMITIFGALITLLLNFLLIPRYSYYASAWATLASYGSMMIVSYSLGKKHYPVKYNLRSFFFFFSITILLYFVSKAYQGNFAKWIELFLNNICVLFFTWLVLKFEYPNFKNPLKINESKIG